MATLADIYEKLETQRYGNKRAHHKRTHRKFAVGPMSDRREKMMAQLQNEYEKYATIHHKLSENLRKYGCPPDDELFQVANEAEESWYKMTVIDKWINSLIDGSLTPDDVLIQKLTNDG